MSRERESQVVIIGGGPAGLSAAIYTSRADLDTLVFDNSERLLDKVDKIENYLGFHEGISGSELLNRGRKQARKFGTQIIEDEVLSTRMVSEYNFVLETADERYISEGLIIAPGIKRRKPDLEGLKDFEGRGVSFCVVCDAPFFKDKETGVLGSENYAAKEALELYNFTRDITIFTNGEAFEVDKKLARALKRKDIPVNTGEVKRVMGDEDFEGLMLESGEHELDGLFIAMGSTGATDFARSLGIPIEDDGISVDENLSTGIPRVYAAGDCIGGVRQLAKAVGEGAQAALNLISEFRGSEYFDW